MDGFRRQLTIKRKVVERNTKDVLSYRKEYSEDARVVQQMEEERREPSDIKQRRNVMNETLMMVCDAESRLTAACKDLCDFISSHADVCRPALREVSSPSDKGPGEAGERPERWLVEELTAVRDALLRATEVNPAHPASMELFEDRDHKDENAGSCEESLDDI